MKLDDFLQSKIFRAIIVTIAALIVIAIVFRFGVFVGTRKASFSFQWADEYHRNFGGPDEGFFGDFLHGSFTNDDSVFGKVLKINFSSDPTQPNQIQVNGSDGVEKVVLIDKSTVIRKQSKDIKLSDINVNDSVVVIGEPNNLGQIQAKLIRVMSLPFKVSPNQTNQSNTSI